MKIKKYICLFIVLFAAPFVMISQRVDTTINTGWLFHKGDVDIKKEKFSSDQWSYVNIPHTWNDEDAFDEEDGFYQGPAWYAKVLNIPNDWESSQVYLHFGGANQETEVYLNNKKIGNHKGGYTAFRFNISPHLKFGTDNLLTVRVTNAHNDDIPPQRMDYTFYGGIYRDVQIIVTDKVHFDMDNYASDGVFTQFGDISAKKANLSVKGSLRNDGAKKQKLRLETKILDREKQVVLSKNIKLNVAEGKTIDFETGNLTIKNPSLWSPDDPYLYQVITSIYSTGKSEKLLDQMVIPLGVRWYEFDDKNRFTLNGEPLKLVGANRHQDRFLKGSALSDEDHKNDLKHIKDLGMNFIRLAHYPQDKVIYQTCDKLGLLVWSEMPGTVRITQSEAFTKNSLNMQTEHIRQTINHPSVVFYGYMNEVMIELFGRKNKNMPEAERSQIADATVKLAKKLEALTKKEAPKHKTVMAVHYTSSFIDGYNKYGITDVSDVLGWNLYFGWYYGDKEDLTPFIAEQHKRYPDRPLIISEYGPGADIRNHTKTPKPWDFTEDYQVILHESYLKQMMNLPYLAGFAAWNFADFGSERRGDAIPNVNQKGLVSFDRKEKAVCNLYRAWFSKEPVLHIGLRNYTNQAGIEDEEGKGFSTQSVKIFSNANNVELWHNGVSLGIKSVNSYTVSFDVPFTNGKNKLYSKSNNGLEDEIEVSFQLYPQYLRLGTPKEIAINVGAHWSFFDPSSKVLWMADREYSPGLWGYEGGKPLIKGGGRQPKTGISNNILGTENDPLFQTFNEGIKAYRFDVKEGPYEIEVCFIEPNQKAPNEELIYNLSTTEEKETKDGSRVFSLKINDNMVLNALNLAQNFGPLRAVTYKFKVFARGEDGIKLEFLPIEGQPVLSGIRVIPE